MGVWVEVSEKRIYFCETLGVWDYLYSTFTNRRIFYNVTTISLKIIISLFKFDISRRSKTIWFGDVCTATGLRRHAYESALEDIREIDLKKWNPSIKNIDFELITEKFLLDSLYEEKEFYNFAKQYIVENPKLDFKYNKNKEKKQNKGIISFFKYLTRIILKQVEYLFGIFLLLLFGGYFLKKNKENRNNQFHLKNSILCEVDQPKIYEMFSTIFGEKYSVHYFIQKNYLKHFSDGELSKLGLNLHSFNKKQQKKVKKITFQFFYNAIRNYKYLSSFGIYYFNLYKVVIHGLLITPSCENSTFLTFEHMSVVKAVRNEFLRASNNKSVFLPYNTYAIDHYFSPEYRYNYDILCSPCRILELVYDIQNAFTKTIFSTGSYSSHRLSTNSIQTENDKVSQLKLFKGENVAITILSCGTEDATISGEIRLMKLATQLSNIKGVNVIIRPKPVTPPTKYQNFFTEYIRDNDSICLTDKSYDLFDFLEVTDLFISGTSSSAVDVCNTGGNFFSINFWDDNDLYLWQTAIDGVYLDEDKAFDTILDWVKNKNGERDVHRTRMQQLRELIGYQFDSFEEYKGNLLDKLTPYLPEEARK